MTRRNFLRALLSLLAGAGILALFSKPKQWAYDLALFFKPRLDPLSPTGNLSETELAFLVAYGETLIAEKGLSETEKNYLRSHFVYQAQTTPGYLYTYRLTAGLLREWADGEFLRVTAAERLRMLTQDGLLSSEVAAREYLSPFRRREVTVRTLVIPDIIAGYYDSPAGWAVVGYQAYPGICGDLARYVRPESVL